MLMNQTTSLAAFSLTLDLVKEHMMVHHIVVQGHFQNPSHYPSPSDFILTMQSTVILCEHMTFHGCFYVPMCTLVYCLTLTSCYLIIYHN